MQRLFLFGGPEDRRRAAYEWASRFGFGRPTGIDLPGERGGNLPRSPVAVASERRSPRARRNFRATPCNWRSGRRSSRPRPCRSCGFMAAVGNGGKLVTPRLVDSAGPALIAVPDSRRQHSLADSSRVRSRNFPTNAGMGAAGAGTGRCRPAWDGLQNGASEARSRSPARQELPNRGRASPITPGLPDMCRRTGPEIAFVVVLENAGSGGHAAGPVARKFVQSMLAHGLLESRSLPLPARIERDRDDLENLAAAPGVSTLRVKSWGGRALSRVRRRGCKKSNQGRLNVETCRPGDERRSGQLRLGVSPARSGIRRDRPVHALRGQRRAACATGRGRTSHRHSRQPQAGLLQRQRRRRRAARGRFARYSLSRPELSRRLRPRSRIISPTNTWPGGPPIRA